MIKRKTAIFWSLLEPGTSMPVSSGLEGRKKGVFWSRKWWHKDQPWSTLAVPQYVARRAVYVWTCPSSVMIVDISIHWELKIFTIVAFSFPFFIFKNVKLGIRINAVFSLQQTCALCIEYCFTLPVSKQTLLSSLFYLYSLFFTR